jgi:tetratricopeptide (TPR) repeat protein
MFNHYDHQPDKAQSCFDLVFKHDGPAYAYQGFMHHLHKTGQHAKLITFMPALEKAFEPDRDIKYLYAQSLEAEGHLMQAASLLTQLAKEHTQQAEIVYNAALVNLKSNNPQQALKIIEGYLAHSNQQKDYIFHFLKGQVLSTINKKHDAVTSLRKAVELNPRFEQGWLVLGLTHQQIGTIDEAIAAFKECMNCSGNNPMLERQIMQLQLQHQGIIGKSTQVNFQKAMQSFDAGHYKEALSIVNESLKLEQGTNMRLLKLEILCRLANVKEAINQLYSYINLDPTNITWFKALDLIYKAGARPAQIQSLHEKLEKEFKGNLLVHLYAADFYLKEDQPVKATDALHAALSITNDPELRTKCYTQLAQAYRKLKNHEGYANALRSAEELNQTSAPLLNMLAYFYAKKGNDLEKAERYIAAALKSEPRNPQYLDTQAVIWYKQNKHDEAIALLTQLSAQEKDPHIHNHLSKVFFKQGTITQAISQLKESINLTTKHEKKAKYTKRLEQWNRMV